MKTWIAILCVLAAGACIAQAAEISVGALGDFGWRSDDTRSNAGVDLVGSSYTHAGKPSQTPTAADDSVIAGMITFESPGAAPADSDGALKLSWSAGSGSGKATLSVLDTTSGFASDNWRDGFTASFRVYRETATNTTLKIGVQSALWSQSQSGFTALRSGEPVWDLILVYAGDGSTGAWQTCSAAADTGIWLLYRQAGNSFFAAPTATGGRTLNGWASDAQVARTISGTDYTWGDLLFGAGAKVSNIQVGAGSFSVPSTGYVDWLQMSLLNGGDPVNFVPEPATMGLLALGGGLMAWGRRRRGTV